MHSQLVEHTGPVHIRVQEAMVTVMMMIVMVVEMKTAMGMEGKENGGIGMMIDMAEVVIHIVEKGIGMVEILMTVMEERVIEMMIIEEAAAMMIISMGQGIGASIETEIVHLMTMTIIHLGMASLLLLSYTCLFAKKKLFVVINPRDSITL